MSYDQFWIDNPEIAKFYRKKYYITLEENNFLLWLNGMYTQVAFSTVMENAFSKNAKAKYLDKPIEILPKSEAELEKERLKQQKQAIAELTRWADRWNKQQ